MTWYDNYNKRRYGMIVYETAINQMTVEIKLTGPITPCNDEPVSIP